MTTNYWDGINLLTNINKYIKPSSNSIKLRNQKQIIEG